MNITVTGASGFLGTRLLERLTTLGHSVHGLARKPPKGQAKRVAFSAWDVTDGTRPAEAFEKAEAVVHLAGEPIAQRWTPEVKRRIRESRSEGTRNLVSRIEVTGKQVRTLVSASAIGYYGSRGDDLLTEASPPGTGFLADICAEWERAAEQARAAGIRVVTIRNGIVLGREGGALRQMLTPFRLGVGGKLGDGQQWMSWIHADDLVELIRFAVEEPRLSGPVNGTTPNPVRNIDFTRALAKALHRPAFLPVPVLALKLLYGEMAEVLTSSQRVLPHAAVAAGFRFQYPFIDDAFEAIFG
ncbi:MAG TPA: TIGR01777 family oxidoreductase [Bryobacteraceae bacterium]|nr:TIGR01777 family oxidoreductase [Bryobacteraceae bacterium]